VLVGGGARRGGGGRGVRRGGGGGGVWPPQVLLRPKGLGGGGDGRLGAQHAPKEEGSARHCALQQRRAGSGRLLGSSSARLGSGSTAGLGAGGCCRGGGRQGSGSVVLQPGEEGDEEDLLGAQGAVGGGGGGGKGARACGCACVKKVCEKRTESGQQHL
jgi:hypothetical protein